MGYLNIYSWNEIDCPGCKGKKEILQKDLHKTFLHIFENTYEATEGSIGYKICPICQGYGKIKICKQKFVEIEKENKFKMLDI